MIKTEGVSSTVQAYNTIHSSLNNATLFESCLEHVLGKDFVQNEGQFSFVGHSALRWIIQKLKLNKKICMAAEIGCGSGAFSKLLSDALNCSLTATDISPVAINMAKNKHYDKKINFDVADFNHLIYNSNSLDVLVGLDCVQHASNYSQLSRELSRVMKLGGRIAFTNWMKTYPGSKLIKVDPLCVALTESGFVIDGFYNFDEGLKKQFKIYDLIYTNRVLFQDAMGESLYASLMNEACHLYQFNGTVSHYAFSAQKKFSLDGTNLMNPVNNSL
jgi:ubiquinone/menaquinone biosynthesis C-methylase UbiE